MVHPYSMAFQYKGLPSKTGSTLFCIVNLVAGVGFEPKTFGLSERIKTHRPSILCDLTGNQATGVLSQAFPMNIVSDALIRQTLYSMAYLASGSGRNWKCTI